MGGLVGLSLIFRSWFAFSDIALPVEKLNDSGHAFDFAKLARAKGNVCC